MNIKLNNISSLDLFRGIAGYGVAICHFYYYLYELSYFQFYSIIPCMSNDGDSNSYGIQRISAGGHAFY